MLKGILFVFLGACSFGVLSTFVKLAYADGFTLGQVTGVQVFFGFIFLWIVTFIKIITKKIKLNTVDKKLWYQLPIVGICSGMVSITYYYSVQLVPVSIAIILLMQFTWITVLIELFIYKKRPSKLEILSLFLILSGTFMASGFTFNHIPDIDLKGIGFGMLAAFFYALIIVFNGKIGTNLSPFLKSGLIMAGGTVLIFAIFPPVYLFDGTILTNLWKYGLFLALFGTIIPPLCFAFGIPKTGLNLSAIISSAELPVAVLMSTLILHEQVTFLQWLGVCIMLSAMVIPNISKLKKQKT